MKKFSFVAAVCMVLAFASEGAAAPKVDASVAEECRAIQREAQTRLEEIGRLRRSQRGHAVRAVVRELRELARQLFERRFGN